jgi:hypothetical protein
MFLYPPTTGKLMELVGAFIPKIDDLPGTATQRGEPATQQIWIGMLSATRLTRVGRVGTVTS